MPRLGRFEYVHIVPVLRRYPMLALALLLATPLTAAVAPSLQPSKPSPWQVGAIVTWTATPAAGAADAFWYRFRARRVGSPFRVWKDFGPDNTFEWTESEHPGSFEIEVAARDRVTGAVSTARAGYTLLTNTNGDQPAILETSHPLVLLFSAQPCAPGSRMKVRFQSADGVTQDTPYKNCAPGLSMNFYLAGLRAQTEYFAYAIVDDGEAFDSGPVLSHTTGPVTADLPVTTILKPAPLDTPEPVILQENVFASQLATDLAGRVIWYYPSAPLAFMTRPAGNGTFFGIQQDPRGNPWNQVLREFNLIGLAIRETNAGRVNEQLSALGKRSINAFHHDALQLPDGNIAVIGGVEQILTGVQGPAAVDVLGDMVIVLDPNLNVVWSWDAFDHLDPHRLATLGEQCLPNACPPLQLAATANDWTHANAIEAAPDGNLLVSFRNQDWVVKINYDSGEGNGDILWKLGSGGDFQLTPSTPTSWFSHQHDPRFEPFSTDRLMILDNGNFRRDTDPNAASRGQVYQLDEAAKTATLVVNDNLGLYSLAVGSTEKLSNGNYWFDAGFLPDASGISGEFNTGGSSIFTVRTAAPVYRSYRLADMYSPVRGTR
uniref:Arylsulfotransferase N-terminal domain-containing protein n=1 Tax=Solibacter usitatus (strain Ellin6076) TaxID=234267 RepID=Q023I8_SOLUE